MTFYGDKYSQMYAPALDAMRGLREDPEADRQLMQNAQNQRGWGQVGNLALSLGGTAVGGLLGSLAAPGVGTAVGAGLGGALGGAAGSALSGGSGGSGAGGAGAGAVGSAGPTGPGIPQGILDGAGMGGKMGAQAGNVYSGWMNNQAEQTLDPIRMREMKRQSLMQLLMSLR